MIASRSLPAWAVGVSARERDSSIDFSMLLSRVVSAVGLLLLLPTRV